MIERGKICIRHRLDAKKCLKHGLCRCKCPLHTILAPKLPDTLSRLQYCPIGVGEFGWSTTSSTALGRAVVATLSASVCTGAGVAERESGCDESSSLVAMTKSDGAVSHFATRRRVQNWGLTP